MTVQFAPGPPIAVPGLGLLPGPIRSVCTATELLVVDDRHPGVDLSMGATRARTVTHHEAVRVVRAQSVTEASPPEVGTPVIGMDEAADLLAISRRTLERAIQRLPRDQRPHAASGRGRGDRVRYFWPNEDGLFSWWRSASAPPLPPARKAPPARHRAAPPPPAPDQPVDWVAVGRAR
jgi:hypothetical protein